MDLPDSVEVVRREVDEYRRSHRLLQEQLARLIAFRAQATAEALRLHSRERDLELGIRQAIDSARSEARPEDARQQERRSRDLAMRLAGLRRSRAQASDPAGAEELQQAISVLEERCAATSRRVADAERSLLMLEALHSARPPLPGPEPGRRRSARRRPGRR